MPPPLPSMLSQRPPHRHDIDGLRAIAVTLVVLHHAFPGALPGGRLGVDVFFVISGYLISQILFRLLDQDALSLVDFYRRRVQRIWPALILVMATTLALGAWLLWPREYQQLGHHAAFNAVFLLNIVLAHESGYFDAAAQLKPLLHLWSLCIEEQFYLVWPLLLLGLHRFEVRALPVTLGLAAASLAVMQQSGRTDAAATFFMPLARAWELMLGGAAAALLHHPNEALVQAFVRWGRRFAPEGLDNRLAPLIGLGLILASAAWLTPQRSVSLYLLVPVGGALLVVLSDPDNSVSRTLLSTRSMTGLGRISYPLYLWHWPLLSLATVVESGLPSARIRGAIVLISVLLAWLTWAGLERPLRRSTARRTPWVLAGLLAATGASGLLIESNAGFPARTAEINPRLADFDWDAPRWLWSAGATTCQARQPVVHGIQTYCNQNLPTPPQTVLLGDSHALQLYPGLAERFARSNQSLLLLGASACPPFFDLDIQWTVDLKDCRSVMNDALGFVLHSPSINTVILADRGAYYVEGLPTQFEMDLEPQTRIRLVNGSEPPAADNAPAYQRALIRTLRVLRDAGKRVIVVIDAPEINLEPRRCGDLRQHTLTTPERPQSLCAVTVEDYTRRARRYLDVTRNTFQEVPDVDVWSLPEQFCDTRLCHGMSGKLVLYRDADHLSLPGSMWIAERFDPQPARSWLRSVTPE